MHVVAAELGVRLAVAIVERERLRRTLDRLVDDVGREQDAFAFPVGLESVIEQAFSEPRSTNLHADLGQDGLRLVENLVDQLI